ncbi:cytochrome c/FTR1 family iron permease [Thermithiobacillus plumbiphilus]|uniref:Cytochrome c/FTR1 family iron permease n=1 Tax=Thermithiobacillus plumbiphilus TaxID=1729899 RepID=A0ABU9DD92_9PROT
MLPLRRSLWLFSWLLLFMLGVQFAIAAPQGAPADRAQRVVHILAYIAGDYGGAVDDGQVVSPSEYQEQQEFSRQAQQLLQSLPMDAGSQQLHAQMQSLITAIGEKAPAERVRQEADQLRLDLITHFNLQTAPQQTPSLSNGKRLFQANCIACHGINADGSGPQAAGMDPAPANFRDKDRFDTISPFGLSNTIHFGVSGTAMPGYGQFSQQELWDLAFYLSAIRYDPQQIEKGKALFEAEPSKWVERFQGLRGLSAQSDVQLLGNRNDPDARAVLSYLRQEPEATRSIVPSLTLSRERLNASWEAYKAADPERAYTLAVSAYLDGFEAVEPALNAVDRDLRTQIETEMGLYRNALRNRLDVAEVEPLHARVLASLDQAQDVLTSTKLSPTTGFLSAFTILLREGLEAVLVVAAIVTLLVRTNRRDLLTRVHAGWIAALFMGVLTWWLARELIQITGARREVIEGVTAMIAVVILFSISYWLIAKLEVEKWRRFLHEKIQKASGKGSVFALAGVTFIAVYREIFETVLFYQALWVQAGPSGHTPVLYGTLAAFVALLGVVWAIFKLGLKLPLRPFFAASSALIYLLAFIFAGKGILALQEAGWISSTPVSFVRIDLLGIYPNLEGLMLQGALTLAMLFALFHTFVWAPRVRVAH